MNLNVEPQIDPEIDLMAKRDILIYRNTDAWYDAEYFRIKKIIREVAERHFKRF